MKNVNDFLCTLTSFAPLLDDVILCTVDLVDLYSNIPHDEELVAIKEALDL